MTSEERAKRRREVIRRLEAGETYAAVGKDLGVSRQAIFAMYKKYEELGDDFFQERKRGRRKERDSLTAAEKKKVHDWLQDHSPADIDRDEEGWPLLAVKHAVFQLTAKRVNLKGAFEVLHYGKSPAELDAIHNRTETPEVEAGVTSEPAPASSPPDSDPEMSQFEDDDDWDLPSLEEMQRLNEESWKSVPWETPSPHGQSYGTRYGKHAKGKRSPTQKKSKRKKKKR